MNRIIDWANANQNIVCLAVFSLVMAIGVGAMTAISRGKAEASAAWQSAHAVAPQTEKKTEPTKSDEQATSFTPNVSPTIRLEVDRLQQRINTLERQVILLTDWQTNVLTELGQVKSQLAAPAEVAKPVRAKEEIATSRSRVEFPLRIVGRPHTHIWMGKDAKYMGELDSHGENLCHFPWLKTRIKDYDIGVGDKWYKVDLDPSQTVTLDTNP